MLILNSWHFFFGFHSALEVIPTSK
ncbi:hypothetical protein ZEAMMB73_Zm00001d043803 [Zea mays]|uniref:Uncharacterized protein n=1 Tax=Zea mays TaxID=4577 RepID=A0A1D6NF34_MAIZE|nr:hypothetical protein ZEAMMB73_Zm00001d043803 [Zea mays]ONM39092.1 hypothetical protein ZEAMMB73_Zm00001d043803 [Zea mays]